MNFVENIKNKLIKNQLINDSFWSLLGNIIGKGLALVAGVFVARFLGKDIYGEYGIIKNTIMAISVLSTFGLGYTSTKYISDFKINKPDYLKVTVKYITRITLVFSSVMAVFLFFFSTYIAERVLNAPSLNVALKLLSVLVIFNAITVTQIGVLAGFGKFKKLARINSIIGGVTFIVSVVLTYYFDLNGALSALLIVQILNCVLNYLEVKNSLLKSSNEVKKDKPLLKSIIIFSSPVAMQEILYSVAQWLGALLLIKHTTFGDRKST